MPYSLTDMALYFFMYSFCGWLMETALCSFQEKRFVNRGFLNGPFCPIYGLSRIHIYQGRLHAGLSRRTVCGADSKRLKMEAFVSCRLMFFQNTAKKA